MVSRWSVFNEFETKVQGATAESVVLLPLIRLCFIELWVISGVHSFLQLVEDRADMLLEQDQGQLNDQEYLLVQEVYAIVRPLTDVVLALTQISRKPIGPATLPLIAFIFSRYGVQMDRGLYGEVNISPRAGEKIVNSGPLDTPGIHV